MSVDHSPTDGVKVSSERSAARDAESHVEVNDLLRNYFGSMEAKDEDIFRLYEDNQRLRDLVEASCTARQELDTRLQTTLLLVASLKTELNEKRCLIEAQEAESAVLREGVADLRGILGKPSQFDFSLDECVAEVAYMVESDRRRHAQTQHLVMATAQLSAYAAQLLGEAEARERAALEDAALTTTRVLVTSVALSADDTARIVDLEQALHTQQMEVDEWRVAQQQAAARAQQQLQEQVRVLQADQAQHQIAYRRLEVEKGKADVCLCAAQSAVDVLASRALAAEGLLHSLYTAGRALACRDADDHDACRAEWERHRDACCESLVHARTTVAKLRGQLAKETKARTHLEGVQERLDEAQTALEALKAKHTAQLEKGNLQHQRQAIMDKRHRDELEASEEKSERQTRRAAALQVQLDHRDDELLQVRKTLRQREKCLEERGNALHSANARVASLEEALIAAQHHTAQRQALESDAFLARLAVGQEEADARVALTLAHQLRLSDENWSTRQAKVVSAYTAELQGWAAIAEEAKARMYELEQQVDGERHAREILEAQQTSESALQRQIMWHVAEQSRHLSTKSDEDQRSARHAAEESARVIHDLRQRVRALEESSEISAVTTRTMKRELQHRHRASDVTGGNISPQRDLFFEWSYGAGTPVSGAAPRVNTSDWAPAESALLDRIDRAMEASSALVTTPSRTVCSPPDLLAPSD